MPPLQTYQPRGTTRVGGYQGITDNLSGYGGAIGGKYQITNPDNDLNLPVGGEWAWDRGLATYINTQTGERASDVRTKAAGQRPSNRRKIYGESFGGIQNAERGAITADRNYGLQLGAASRAEQAQKFNQALQMEEMSDRRTVRNQNQANSLREYIDQSERDDDEMQYNRELLDLNRSAPASIPAGVQTAELRAIQQENDRIREAGNSAGVLTQLQTEYSQTNNALDKQFQELEKYDYEIAQNDALIKSATLAQYGDGDNTSYDDMVLDTSIDYNMALLENARLLDQNQSNLQRAIERTELRADEIGNYMYEAQNNSLKSGNIYEYGKNAGDSDVIDITQFQ